MFGVVPRSGLRLLLSRRPPAGWSGRRPAGVAPLATSTSASPVWPVVFVGGALGVGALLGLEFGSRDERKVPEVVVQTGILDMYRRRKAQVVETIVPLYNAAVTRLSGGGSQIEVHQVTEKEADEILHAGEEEEEEEEEKQKRKEETKEAAEEKEAKMLIEAMETIAAEEAMAREILAKQEEEAEKERIGLQEVLLRLEAEELSRPALEASRARECVREACELGSARTEAALTAAREEWSRREALALKELEDEFNEVKASEISLIQAEAKAAKAREIEAVVRRWEEWRETETSRALNELEEKKAITQEVTLAEEAQASGDAALAVALRLGKIASRVAAARAAAFDVAGDDATARAAHARLALDLVSSPNLPKSKANDALRQRWTARVLPNALAAAKRPAVDADAPLFDAAIGSIVAKIELASGSTVLSETQTLPPEDRADFALHLADAAVKARDFEAALLHLESIKDPKTNSILRDWKLDATAAATAVRDKQLKDARALILAAARSDALSQPLAAEDNNKPVE